MLAFVNKEFIIKILWYVSQLNQSGGGDRYALATAELLREYGHNVIIACDSVGPAASFDGRYDLSSVISFNEPDKREISYVKKVIKKAFGLWPVIKLIWRERPEMLFCQSEYDAIRLMAVTRIFRVPFRVHIFGQMYQFRSDLSKYSWIFKGDMPSILESCPGYKDNLIEHSFVGSPLTWLINEAISVLKYISVRKADKIFCLSEQVKGEVKLLYGKSALVLRAAIDVSDIAPFLITQPKEISKNPNILSVCRLEPKKRVDVLIRAFIRSKLNGTLTIIGEGPELERLKSLAEMRSDIIFLGRVSDVQREEALITADCFVSMDLSDFVITVIEAMAKGKRVIVSREFDVDAIGAEIDGLMVVDANVKALTYELDNLDSMPGPSAKNLEALSELTWQYLATECIK